jgi:hypothetical protein
MARHYTEAIELLENLREISMRRFGLGSREFGDVIRELANA